VPEARSVGVVGARGYVGAELLGLLSGHPHLEPVFACSRSSAGEWVADKVGGAPAGLRFEDLAPEDVASAGADAVVLCLPDGEAAGWVSAVDAVAPGIVVLDVSADHRFDSRWTYGLAEHARPEIAPATRISNPGCYATAAQLALRPLLGSLAETPHCFGVSGYSGAGRTLSPRNDLAMLDGGVTPYKLVHHTHEREISRHLGRAVRFSPHVAPFFRGIVLTVQARLDAATDAGALRDRFASAYAAAPMVEVREEMPRAQDVAGSDSAMVGGFSVNPERADEVALVAVIDNLGKGAAGQAVQNLNLALGLPETAGLRGPRAGREL
jgi:N-acetyl-gamma-glutamyl-phosphate reductase